MSSAAPIAPALLSVGFGWAISGRVLAPLHRMTATARKLSEENLHERIALDGPDDELKGLADTFDAMLARLESAFDSQKRFGADASHELRTPLSIIRTEVDVALANPDATPGELRRMGEVVRRATGRSEALIDGLLVLLVLARSDRGPATLAPVDLALLAEEAVAQAAAEAAAASEVRLAVPNAGALIDPADVDGLFEPFRRLGADRVAGRGAGLGLSIVRSVTVAHGGRVSARPRPGGGLIVEVVLPRRESRPSP